MHRRLKFSLGGVLIVLAVLYLIFTGMSETGAYFLTVSEAVRYEQMHHGEAVRVKGNVRTGSIDWHPRELADVHPHG